MLSPFYDRNQTQAEPSSCRAFRAVAVVVLDREGERRPESLLWAWFSKGFEADSESFTSRSSFSLHRPTSCSNSLPSQSLPPTSLLDRLERSIRPSPGPSQGASCACILNPAHDHVEHPGSQRNHLIHPYTSLFY